MAANIASKPIKTMNQPDTRVMYMPQRPARTNVSHMPVFTSDGDNKPAWVTRKGPKRLRWSAPFSKSKTSLAKFAPICSNNAPKKAAKAGKNRNPPSANATALPMITGETAAGNVFGREASTQVWNLEIFFGWFINYYIQTRIFFIYTRTFFFYGISNSPRRTVTAGPPIFTVCISSRGPTTSTDARPGRFIQLPCSAIKQGSSSNP